MRILLTANASYVPPRGGATRSNLVWLDHLVRAGHECRVVAGLLARDPAGRLEQLRDEEISLESRRELDGVEQVDRGGILVCSVADPARRSQALREQVRDFSPDWVLVSSEDIGGRLLREAHQAAPGRVVYLAHTPQFFPFGPATWSADPHGAELVARSAGVVAISQDVAAYIERHIGRRPVVIHPPIYGRPPYPRYGRFDSGLVAMINPCAVKGIGIFLALAERFPQYEFGALPGWGTTAAGRRAMERLPNIRLLPNCRDIDEFLSRARVLLMPSLWYEGFGLIVVEAMLRGIPVIASDSGGLSEAKLGTRFIVPVRPIERFEPVFDEHGMPQPVMPPQEVEPWAGALQELLADRRLYEAESEASRKASLEFVSGLRADAMERFLSGLKPRLRILLAHNSTYYPAHGGGDKSNRLLVEALAARGHACRVVARLAAFGREIQERYAQELAARGVAASCSEGGVVAFPLNGVAVRVLAAREDLRAYFTRQIEEFAPDAIVCSTDDPAQLLLQPALKAERARVVYLARATLALPFGPDCAFPSASKTQALARADAVVGVSQYVAGYIRRWGGIEAVHVPISLLDPGPYPELGRFENEFVTLVNPCAVKGISIFLALADRLPQVRFAAVPTWGTNAADLAELRRRANIQVLDPVDDIGRLLERTRVLLAPSLWAEARSRIIVEAMLRGVPVMASNVGGIPEAKLGVPYLLPVRPIEKYDPRLDEQMVPVAQVPEQDVEPWIRALERLLGVRAHWTEIARASREAALMYAENLSVEPFEKLLRDTPRKSRGEPLATVSTLPPEKRRWLAARLKKKTAAGNPWFPNLRGGALRLFCFPHAGGGAAAFHGWAQRLPQAAVCPVRLPGRESRLAEAPFLRMAHLVEALEQAIQPYLGEPFAFFGHSMGAVVAFELARRLRTPPAALLVSAARAPQFRAGWVPPPEPSEEELLEHVRRLEGVPPEVLENPELIRLLLPALRADASLYRHYVYEEGPPLACPIRAYGGAGDRNIAPEHLEGWRRQTTASFAVRMFPGGHFFLRSSEAALLEALAADLAVIVP